MRLKQDSQLNIVRRVIALLLLSTLASLTACAEWNIPVGFALYDKDGKRTGTAVESGDRLLIYDQNYARVGTITY